jgi:hypothetical protein
MLSDHALSEAVSIHKNQEQDWLARFVIPAGEQFAAVRLDLLRFY